MGVRGGHGEESKDQHVGEVWRFEEDVGNGGTGVGSFKGKAGSEDIEGSGIGATDSPEDCRIERVVGSEDCSVGGVDSVESLRKTHMSMLQRTIFDRRHLQEFWMWKEGMYRRDGGPFFDMPLN